MLKNPRKLEILIHSDKRALGSGGTAPHAWLSWFCRHIIAMDCFRLRSANQVWCEDGSGPLWVLDENLVADPTRFQTMRTLVATPKTPLEMRTRRITPVALPYCPFHRGPFEPGLTGSAIASPRLIFGVCATHCAPRLACWDRCGSNVRALFLAAAIHP